MTKLIVRGNRKPESHGSFGESLYTSMESIVTKAER